MDPRAHILPTIRNFFLLASLVLAVQVEVLLALLTVTALVAVSHQELVGLPLNRWKLVSRNRRDTRLSSLEPLTAKPSSPANVVPVRDVAGLDQYRRR